MALKDREEFYGRLSCRMEKQYLADTDSLKREYESLAGRNQEIDDTFVSLYYMRIRQRGYLQRSVF